MLKNRLLKLLPILLALLLVFTVSVFAAMADPEEETSEAVSEETTADETSAEEASDTASEETSGTASEETSGTASEETSKAASEATSSAASETSETSAPADDRDHKEASNIPWKLIITVAVILVIAAVLFILAKTNSKLGQKIAKFFKDYKSEIGKISWMSRKDLLRSTLVVLAVLIIASVAIGLLDYGFSALVKLLSSIG